MAEIEYPANGVTVSPAIPRPGDMVKVNYNGLLAKGGASQITARIGFDLAWENAADMEMTKTPAGFQTSVQIYPDCGTLNVCFRDSAGNWDNNSGENYSFLLGKNERPVKK